LPGETQFRYTGPDRLLLLIIGRMPSPSANLSADAFLEDLDLVSIHFLLNYQNLLTDIRQQCEEQNWKKNTVRSWVGTGSLVRTPCGADNSVGHRRPVVEPPPATPGGRPGSSPTFKRKFSLYQSRYLYFLDKYFCILRITQAPKSFLLR
jgi:hypothetical protein